jgi:hypothetical protein
MEIFIVIFMRRNPQRPPLWARFGVIQNDAAGVIRQPKNPNMKKRRESEFRRRFTYLHCERRLLVVFGLQDLAAAIVAAWADMVTHVGLASGWLNCQLRCNQEVMRTMHATLRRGFFVLLNSHDNS